MSDLVNANLIALTERGDNAIYNIASGVEVSDSQIFEEVRQASDATVEAAHADKRPGEADRVSLDYSRAKAALGWEPQVPLHEGIRLAVEWHRRRLEL